MIFISEQRNIRYLKHSLMQLFQDKTTLCKDLFTPVCPHYVTFSLSSQILDVQVPQVAHFWQRTVWFRYKGFKNMTFLNLFTMEQPYNNYIIYVEHWYEKYVNWDMPCQERHLHTRRCISLRTSAPVKWANAQAGPLYQCHLVYCAPDLPLGYSAAYLLGWAAFLLPTPAWFLTTLLCAVCTLICQNVADLENAPWTNN